MKLISISGLDGSGKSTQIKLLRIYLETQQQKVFYFHMIEFGIAKKIIDFRNRYCLICKLTGKCKVYKEKSVTQAGGFQIFLRKLFLRIDIYRFKKLCKKLKQENFDYILSDRYFYDGLINIAFLENTAKINFLLKIPKPNLAIYLKVDPKIIMQRERKPDQGLEYLQKKEKLLQGISKKWNLIDINGNQEQAIIFNEIKSKL